MTTTEQNQTYYVIRSCGTQGGALALNETFTDVARFARQKDARAYADTLIDSMPSKYLPLRVERVMA